ncbi:hypothetical protein COB64_03380 [Candidatus Wolfebacteria bacterium]|nr:MAG: hypothetical protein COB64_03380 [Candidatus Wolfebacteria bacterium]
METTPYKVKTDAFEGPLDLLLSLIEKRKLFISEISLSEVTDDYISYVSALSETSDDEQSGGIRMIDTTYFIVVAATLILLKSKSLLPNLSLTDEEQSSIEDLELRLRMYKKIKEASVLVGDTFGTRIIFSKPFIKSDISVFVPSDSITLNSMTLNVKDVLGRVPKKEYKPDVRVTKVINIEEMMDTLTERMKKSIKMSFKDFSGDGSGGNNKEQKVYAIVGFLALLELVRQGLVHASQHDTFGEIQMEKESPYSDELEDKSV